MRAVADLRAIGLVDTSSLSLPIDVWEGIIDIVDDSCDKDIHSRTLAACSLIRRGCVARSRYHLFRRPITLRSHSSLVSLVKALTSSPQYCSLVSKLIVDGANSAQSWISAIAPLLGPKLCGLKELTLVHIDLALTHPRFFMAYSLFSEPPDTLSLLYPRYSCYTQVTQLVAATRCNIINIFDDSGSSQCRQLQTPRNRGSYTKTSHMTVTLPWCRLRLLGSLCTAATAHLRRIKVSLPSPTSNLIALTLHLGALYEQMTEMFHCLSHGPTYSLELWLGDKYLIQLCFSHGSVRREFKLYTNPFQNH